MIHISHDNANNRFGEEKIGNILSNTIEIFFNKRKISKGGLLFKG
jgi:hypothetical protein